MVSILGFLARSFGLVGDGDELPQSASPDNSPALYSLRWSRHNDRLVCQLLDYTRTSAQKLTVVSTEKSNNTPFGDQDEVPSRREPHKPHNPTTPISLFPPSTSSYYFLLDG